MGNVTPLEGTSWERDNLVKGKDKLSLITASHLKAGPIWELKAESVSHLFEDSVDKGSPPDLVNPDWNVLDHLSPSAQSAYLHHQYHRLARAEKLGALFVGKGFNLTLDPAGFISVPGASLITPEELKHSPRTYLLGRVFIYLSGCSLVYVQFVYGLMGDEFEEYEANCSSGLVLLYMPSPWL